MRWRYVVKPAFQLKFVAFAFLSMLGVLVFILWNAYFSLGKELFGRLADPDAMALFWRMNLWLAMRLGVYTAILLVLVVFLSHKVAGPLYRFERSSEEIARGRLSHRIRLRKRDALQDLQGKLNAMIASLQGMVSKDRARATRLADDLRDLSERSGLPPEARKKLAELGGDAARITSEFEI